MAPVFASIAVVALFAATAVLTIWLMIIGAEKLLEYIFFNDEGF